MTRAELRAAIKRYLDRPTLADADVDLWIDITTGKLNTALAEHPRMHTRRLFTLPAGESLLPLPTDLLRLRVLRTGHTVWRLLGAADAGYDSEWGPAYIMRGDVAEVFPCPAEDTTFAMDYHMALGSENWVMDLFPQVYVFGCLVEAAEWLKDAESMASRSALFASAIDALLAQGWNEQNSTGMRVRAL
jgi:hypothetical protein